MKTIIIAFMLCLAVAMFADENTRISLDKCEINQDGTLSCSVIQVIDDKSILVNDGNGLIARIYNIDAKNITDGQKLRCYVKRTGTYKYESTLKTIKNICDLAWIKDMPKTTISSSQPTNNGSVKKTPAQQSADEEKKKKAIMDQYNSFK